MFLLVLPCSVSFLVSDLGLLILIVSAAQFVLGSSLRLECRRLLDHLVEDVTEALEGLLRHRDGGAEVVLHLRNSHIDATAILCNIEMETLVIGSEMLTGWHLPLEASILGSKLLQHVADR